MDVPAEPRTGCPRIDHELLRNAELLGRDVRGVDQADGLDIQFVRDDGPVLAFQFTGGRRHNGQIGERQAHPKVRCLAQAGSCGADLPGPFHPLHQVRGSSERRRRRPVRQMHGTAAGKTPPDFLGDQGQQRSRNAGHRFQAGVEDVERSGVLIEETLPAAAHIPVGERVEVAAQGLTRVADVERVERGRHILHEVAGVREDVPVQRVAQCVRCGRVNSFRLVAGAPGGGIRVETEEVPHVPQRQNDLTDAVADSLLGDHEVAAAQDRRGHQEPAHGVRAVPVEDLGNVRVVLQALGHLLAVRTQHDAVADDVLERRPVKQRRGEDVQRVEPAAGLTDVLHDEIGGVVGLEPVLVLHRVVNLRVRHGSGIKPDIEHISDATHGGLAVLRGPRIVRVGTGQLVDERTVQVRLSGCIARQAPEVPLDVREGAVHVGARVVRVIRHPHGDGTAPIAVAADGPVAGVLQPLAELAVLDVARDPVDLLVELDHAVLDLGDLDEPGGHRTVDQRVAAAPAVRVAVHVAGLAYQAAGVAQHPCDGLVRFEDLHTDDLRQRSVLEGAQEACSLIDREDHLDSGVLTDLLVLFTVGRRLVDNTGAVRRRDVVSDEEPEGVAVAAAFRIREVVPQRNILQSTEFGAAVGADDGGARLLRGGVAEVLCVPGQQFLGDQEPAARELAGARNQRVVDVRPDGEGSVGGKRPRRGGPGQRLDTGEVLRQGRISGDDRERHGDGLVLAVLVDVVVHPQFMVGERRLILPAVGQYPVAVIGEAL